MKISKIYCLLLLLLVFTTPAQSSEVRVSAAGSLVDVIKSMVATYKQNHPQTELLVNFASSGALAKQIIAGAPADIYISANPKWMKHLQKKKMVADNTKKTLAYNSLVFIGSAELQIVSLADILPLGKITLGSPKSVPAGKYAEQALTSAGIYQQLQSDNKLVFSKDVRQALLYADRGEVDGAFVYRTDALLAQQAKILLVVSQKLYPQVTYPAALLKGAEKNSEAIDFFDFLFSPEGKQILMKYGFELAA